MPQLIASLGVAPGGRILDVGCGIGVSVRALRESGYEAYGLEPGGRYNNVANDLKGSYVLNEYADALHPEAVGGLFDICLCNGVIEHVGTENGHDRLAPDYREVRRAFVNSLVQLTNPGGYVLVMCPNRLFPLDFQHGPHTYGALPAIRRVAPTLRRMTLPWHRENYLPSYRDLRQLFSPGVDTVSLMPQTGYLALSSLSGRPVVSGLFRGFERMISVLPEFLRQGLQSHLIVVARVPASK